MSRDANGYFQAYVNEMAQRLTSDDKALMKQVSEVVSQLLVGGQVRWAGSQRKRTAIVGSDLDLCVESRDPVTEAVRRELRAELARCLGRAATIQSRAIRLPATGERPKVDIAFANAAFGSRPLPDAGEFHDRPSRQRAARALKLWTRAGGLPWVSGWAVEALVVHLDQATTDYSGLELFLHILSWLDAKASAAAVEGVLRPAAFPRWREEWSERLPGRVQALSDRSRSLLRRPDGPESWTSPHDVGAWLGR